MPTVGPALVRVSLLIGAPLLVAYAWTTCRAYDCALSAPLIDVVLGGASAIADLLAAAPRPTLAGFGLFAAWYLGQALLTMVLPGATRTGVPTPAGHRLEYRLNGLLAWVVTHGLLYLAAFRWALINPTLFYDHGGGLLVSHLRRHRRWTGVRIPAPGAIPGARWMSARAGIHDELVTPRSSTDGLS